MLSEIPEDDSLRMSGHHTGGSVYTSSQGMVFVDCTNQSVSFRTVCLRGRDEGAFRCVRGVPLQFGVSEDSAGCVVMKFAVLV